MPAQFHYFSVFEHNNLVGIFYRAQTMCNRNYSFAFVKIIQIFNNYAFIIRIKRIGIGFALNDFLER